MADLLNLTKEESLNLLDLRKEQITKLCLEKKSLSAAKSRVALVLDYSGSMHKLYKNGTVQSVIERALPLAMQFDDNGEMEVWLFDDKFRRLPSITLKNYYGYIEKEVNKKNWHMGGTCYAPVMKDVAVKYIEEEPAKLPNYVMFITDGNNSDKAETTREITALADHPIFFQFIGIGHEKFQYLEKLDTLEGRRVDNAGFFKIDDIVKVSDEELYSQLLKEYPEWLENDEVKIMIENADKNKKISYKNIKGLFGKIFG